MKLVGKEVRESFCLDASVDDRALFQLARTMCQDLDVPRQCEHVLVKAIKVQLDAYTSAEQASPANRQERLEVIKLDFHAGNIHIKDQFVWDVGDPRSTPEDFAQVTCKDLNLPLRFVPEIAYHIREQLVQIRQAGKKGSVPPLILDEPVVRKPSTRRSAGQSPDADHRESAKARQGFVAGRKGVYLSGVVRSRSEWEEWCPKVTELQDKEVKQLEIQAKKARQQALAASPGAPLPSGLAQQAQEKLLGLPEQAASQKRARPKARSHKAKPKPDRAAQEASGTARTPAIAASSSAFSPMASGTSTAALLLPVAHAHPAGFPPMPTNSGLNTPMLQHSGMPDPKSMTTGSQGVGQTMGGGFNGLVPDQRAGTHPYGIDSLLHMQYWHHQQQQKQQHHQHPQHQPQQQHQQQQQQQQHAQQQQQQQHAPQQAHHVVGQLHQYPQQSQQQHQQQHQPQQQQQQPQQSQHHHQQQQHLRAMGAMMMGGMSGTSPPGPMPHAIGMGGVNSATVTSPHSGEQANPYARFGLASHFDPRRYR